MPTSRPRLNADRTAMGQVDRSFQLEDKLPEVVDVIGKHMDWSVKNNCALSIYVLNNTSTFRQLNEMFAKGGVKEVAMTFRTMAEAEKYIKDKWIPQLPKSSKAS